MCGRFTLTSSAEELARTLGLGPEAFDGIEYRPRYNIAPTQRHVIVRERREERQLLTATWGLVNTWAHDAKRAGAQINARSESVSQRRAFRGAWERRRRCLVPADGFFEWSGPKTARQPLWFHRPEGGLLLFAGLYESWQPAPQPEPERWHRSFTILTTGANATVAPIHDRMPVILSPQDAAEWVHAGNDPDIVQPLLRPAGDDVLVGEPVSRRVNAVTNDDPACLTIEPSLETAQQSPLFD